MDCFPKVGTDAGEVWRLNTSGAVYLRIDDYYIEINDSSINFYYGVPLENFVIPANIMYTSSMFNDEDKNVERTSLWMPSYGSYLIIPNHSRQVYSTKNLKNGSSVLIETITTPVENIAINDTT